MPDALAPDARTLWKQLGSDGMLRRLYSGEAVDPAFGLDPAALGELLAMLDAEHDLGTTLSVCVQVATTLPILIGRDGPAAQVAEDALDGRSVVAFAATDADAPGSDLTALSTRVELGDGEVRLTGAKQWIVNATTADHAVVLARHRPGDHFTCFTLLLVPTGAQGVTSVLAPTAFFAGSGTGELRFDDVRLPASCVIGRPGQGLAEFARRMSAERLAGGLWAAALCRRVLADTRDRLANRVVRGQPLWQNTAIRQRFAQALLEQRRLAALCAAVCAPAGPGTVRPDTSLGATMVQAMLVKAAAAQTVHLVLNECAQLYGAEGFTAGGIQQLRAEAAMFGIAGGSSETMLAGIADHAAELLEAR